MDMVEEIKQFRYLGVVIDNRRNIHETIKDRIQARNIAYFANNKMLRNQQITKATKLKKYYDMPCNKTHESEIWTLNNTEDNALRSFERKILRRIYGPIKVQNEWRIRNKQEFQDLIRGQTLLNLLNPKDSNCWDIYIECQIIESLKECYKVGYMIEEELEDQS